MKTQEFGSLTNHIFGNSNIKTVTPEVGMGATQVLWSDRHAFTIVEVISERKIVVQQNKAIRADNNGMSESQTYRFEPDPNAPRLTLTLRKRGHWAQMSRGDGQGDSFLIGKRDEYHDFSF